MLWGKQIEAEYLPQGTCNKGQGTLLYWGR